MSHNEMTMSEVLHDPLIRLILRADRVPLGELARIMEDAARAKNLVLSTFANKLCQRKDTDA